MISQPVVELPVIQPLYRYCSWQSEFQKRILTHKELYFANPDKFNDPFDCIVNCTPTGTSKDIWTSLVERVNQDFPDLSRSKRRERAKILLKQKNFKIPEKLQESHYELLRKKYGIVSLSEVYDNLLMWSHYADSHKGFCVELDCNRIVYEIRYYHDDGKKTPLIIRAKKVNYYRDWPRLEYQMLPSYADSRSTEELEKQVSQPLITKSIDWEYEKEWRLISHSICNFTIPIEVAAVTAIYLGAKMPQAHKDEIIALCHKDFPHAKLYQAAIKVGSFGLDFTQIR